MFMESYLVLFSAMVKPSLAFQIESILPNEAMQDSRTQPIQ